MTVMLGEEALKWVNYLLNLYSNVSLSSLQRQAGEACGLRRYQVQFPFYSGLINENQDKEK